MLFFRIKWEAPVQGRPERLRDCVILKNKDQGTEGLQHSQQRRIRRIQKDLLGRRCDQEMLLTTLMSHLVDTKVAKESSESFCGGLLA